MAKQFLGKNHRVELNGHDLTHVLNVSIDKMGKEVEQFEVLDDNFAHEIELHEFASGTVNFKSIENPDSSEPLSYGDVLSMVSGHAEYDTTNEVMTMVQTDVLDATNEKSGITNQGSAVQRISEIRNIGSNASHNIDDTPTEESWAQSFICGGEDIYKIKLKLATVTASPIDSFDIEIWSNHASGYPDAKLTNSKTMRVYNSSGTTDFTNTPSDLYLGSTASITAFADAGGGDVTVTSANHGLSSGTLVTISGTTDYNGTFSISSVTTNTFDITDTWVSDDGTGTWVSHPIAHAASPIYTDTDWITLDLSGQSAKNALISTGTFTIGTTYWLVIRNPLAATEKLYVSYDSAGDYDGGFALNEDNISSPSSWDDSPGGSAVDLSFIIQFLTDAGYQIRIHDFVDAAETSSIIYQFDSVRFMTDSGVGFEPKKATEGTLNWESKEISITTT